MKMNDMNHMKSMNMKLCITWKVSVYTYMYYCYIYIYIYSERERQRETRDTH